METSKDIQLLRHKLKHLKEPYIKTIIAFGSKARGESTNRSDTDLLVLHENCNIKDPVKRRRYIYNQIRKALGRNFEALTVIDMELRDFIEPKEISGLLLNIYWDAVIVYDNTTFVSSFLDRVKNKIAKSKLKRVKDGKAYRWILPKPMKEVKIL
jgi:predicted nucleotidyltransferase